MGHAAKTYMSGRKDDRAKQDELPPAEAKALERLRDEAAAKGVTLATGGKGGLPPSLVLGVMRRDGYRCHRCGGRKDLSLHHKAGVVASRWLSRLGHANKPEAIVTVCMACHDAIHDKARAEGIDSSQVLPEGDIGTKHDHGQPVAYRDEE